MKKIYLIFTFCLSLTASGQVLVLDDFNSGFTTNQGSEAEGFSWVGQVTQNLNTITVGGSAKDDNGWSSFPDPFINGSTFSEIIIIAQRDVGNEATSFSVVFTDSSFNAQAFTINTNLFLEGSLTTVTIPITWNAGFSPNEIVLWSMGGGNTGSVLFKMTFDELSLSTMHMIPEPSTYALLGGGVLLVLLMRRRRAA